MEQKTIGRYKPEHVESAIRRRVEELDNEKIFWLRTDIGMDYLRRRFPEDRAQEVWKNKVFWNWFLRIWESNDRKIMAIMHDRNVNYISISQYKMAQEQYVNDYEIDNYLIS